MLFLVDFSLSIKKILHSTVCFSAEHKDVKSMGYQGARSESCVKLKTVIDEKIEAPL
jgi:hypothetical protein